MADNHGQPYGAYSADDIAGDSSLSEQRLEDIQQRAEQAEREAQESEAEAVHANKKLDALMRVAAAEARKEAARKRVQEIQKRTAKLERDIQGSRASVGAEDFGQKKRPFEASYDDSERLTTRVKREVDDDSQRLTTRMKREADDLPERLDLIPGQLGPAGDAQPRNHAQGQNPHHGKKRARSGPTKALKHSWGTTTQEPKPGAGTVRHGTWGGEIGAYKTLGEFLALPLIQTSLNYLEFYLTTPMISELAQVLFTHPAARKDINILRKEWGGPHRDYFSEGAAVENWTCERTKRSVYSWNIYNFYGSIRVDLADKAEFRGRALYFGCGSATDLFGGKDASVPFSKLYRAFLRTKHAFNSPCISHEIGILQAQDVCKGCGCTGAYLGLP